MKIEQYCEECGGHNRCLGKCDVSIATVTCAAPGCDVIIRYPKGTRHPKYCTYHLSTMRSRINHALGNDYDSDEKDDELYT